MGNNCVKREQPPLIQENETLDYNPVKIGNLIFIDYSKSDRKCGSVQELISATPDCTPTQLNCSSVLKNNETSKHSIVEIIGMDLETSEELIMTIEIHENWALIQLGNKESIEKVLNIDRSNIELHIDLQAKPFRTGFHGILEHVNYLIGLGLDPNQENYGKFLYRQIKLLIG